MEEKPEKDSSDDILFEDGEMMEDTLEVEEVEAASHQKIKKFREKLRACEAEKRDCLEKLQRAQADFLNAKRRMEESRKQEKESTIDRFLVSLLPLCDSFDMAMQDTEVWQSIDETWRKGVEAIHAQLHAVLSSHNVTSIEALGQSFDPEKHEAVGAEDAKEETDTVIKVLQKGYERNGTLIRPAKVILST